MKRLLIILVMGMMVLPIFSQEKVTEEVKIDWWVLPLFAIDKSGHSVLDLKDEDIELRINGRQVTGFTLYKRDAGVETAGEAASENPGLAKRKLVFFLFDIAYTCGTNFERSKEIARDMVRKAEKNTLFSILMIDPLSGPVYIGGPLSDKKQVLSLLDNSLKWDPLTKRIETVMLLAGATQLEAGESGKGKGSESKGARLNGRDITILAEQGRSGLRRASMNYYMSFQTLYYALNTIKDNKFVYLFSEGVSLYVHQMLARGGEFWLFVKKTADYLSRCGAVLFIVNPSGAVFNYKIIQSGEDSLRFLARESGGKYMGGTTKTIAAQIQAMNHSYYEIAFPDEKSFGDKVRDITIRSQRKGVKVHSLRSLEKSKPYSEMKDIEKEALVLNLLNPSPLLNSPLKTRPLKVDKKIEKGGLLRYKIKLPRDFKEKSIDIFKIWLNKTPTKYSVKKESIVTTNRALEIAISPKENSTARIVLVNGKQNTALVQGFFDAEAREKSILSRAEADFQKKAKQMKPRQIETLTRIRDGAAGYCTKLGAAVFHCICKETVSEVLDKLHVQKMVKQSDRDIFKKRSVKLQNIPVNRPLANKKVRNKYVNDYQVISNNGRVIEQRKLIKGTIKKIKGKDELLKLDSFISRKISLSPLSLLGDGNQERFFYRFVKYDRLQGGETAVIECFPRDTSGIKSVYGKIWVDLEDFSVMRMLVNPVSIGGYTDLLKLAAGYKAKLVLTCDISFFKKRGGIRLPTKVLIREMYIGGMLKSLMNKNIWERSKTTYTFDDYRFFDVSATAKEEKIEK